MTGNGRNDARADIQVQRGRQTEHKGQGYGCQLVPDSPNESRLDTLFKAARGCNRNFLIYRLKLR